MFNLTSSSAKALSALLTAATILLAAHSAEAAPGADRVEVCHRPPGHPEGAKTLVVGAAALRSHLAHGDTPGACQQVPCEVRCDDGNPCTTDTCSASGDCVNTPLSCDDGNACTIDACDPRLGCVNTAAPAVACDDGDACTASDSCRDDGTCHGAGIPGCCATDGDCSDGSSCTIDRCDSTRRCVHDAVVCDDGNACTVDACDEVSGQCVAQEKMCSDGDPTTTDVCVAATGACESLPICQADQSPCSDHAQCCSGLCGGSGICVSQCNMGLEPPPGFEPAACNEQTDCCTGACIGGYCWADAGFTCGLPGDPCDNLAGNVCCFELLCGGDGTCQ